VYDDWKALEISDALTIAIGKAGEGLLVDLLNLVQILGDVGLSSIVALLNEGP